MLESRDKFDIETALDVVPTTLHLFTQHGKTFTFRKVIELETNESELTFGYVAKSDGRLKRAHFLMANLAGYSVLDT